jgi:hypothetical protein
VRSLRRRDQRQWNSAELSDVLVDELESNAVRIESRGAKMNNDEKIRDEEGNSAESAQRKLTTSVGTRLVKPEKHSRRKLFGRRGRPATKS